MPRPVDQNFLSSSRLPALPELLLQASELRDTLQILIRLNFSDKKGGGGYSPWTQMSLS